MLDKKLLYAVVGLGETGFSVIKFLAKRQYNLIVADTRDDPPRLADFKALNLFSVPLALGPFEVDYLKQADVIILSPGIAVTNPAIAQLIKLGKPVISDIEVFAQFCTSKIVAITGSNGKSTTTAMLGAAAEECGLRVFVGGNIGIPILDVLEAQGSPQETDLFVVELSSFQLHMTYSLKLAAAAILNLTPNHLDRHVDFAEYHAAKHKIFSFAHKVVFNREDLNTYPPEQSKALSFGLDRPEASNFGLIDGYLVQGTKQLLPASDLLLLGKHNIANALAVLALGISLGLPLPGLLQGIKSFKGLPHRCQLIKHKHDILWINDSKASTVEACLATVAGVSAGLSGKVVLIAGGSDKGTGFEGLRILAPQLRILVLIGQTAPKIEAVFQGAAIIFRVNSLQEAVTIANQYAIPGDAVILAPACASLDMFTNFMERGEKFIAEVMEA